MSKRLISRHKNCGGFILPDIEHSFAGMYYGYCPKCGKDKLRLDCYDNTEEEDVTLYHIRNKNTGEYLLFSIDDGDSYTVIFESEEQAIQIAESNGLTDYEVEPNVAFYCDNMPVTNGRMVIKKEDE